MTVSPHTACAYILNGVAAAAAREGGMTAYVAWRM